MRQYFDYVPEWMKGKLVKATRLAVMCASNNPITLISPAVWLMLRPTGFFCVAR